MDVAGAQSVTFQVYVINADGTGERMAGQDGAQPFWSPTAGISRSRGSPTSRDERRRKRTAEPHASAGRGEACLSGRPRRRSRAAGARSDLNGPVRSSEFDTSSRSRLKEVRNESSTCHTRRARGGGHADIGCGGPDLTSETARGDRHEDLSAGKSQGTFVLTPLQAGPLKTDSGTISHNFLSIPGRDVMRDGQKVTIYDGVWWRHHRKARNPHDP